jgi:UPF0271 protein
VVAIDLNSDLGEGYGIWSIGDDAAILDVVTSANIACGFHAGDPSIIRATCADAVHRDVAIGAHVSYQDLAGFGRRHIQMEPSELRDAVLYQLGALDGFAQVAQSEVAYVKPHGALYHAASTERAVANAVVAAAAEYDPSLAILGPPGSELLIAAERADLESVAEAFVDRAYRPDGSLVSRQEPDSVLVDLDQIAERALRLAVDNEVVAVDGSVLTLKARSLCIHGDTPDAIGIAKAVRSAFDAAGIGVHRFSG